MTAKAKDGAFSVAALIAALLLWYRQYKADEDHQRNLESNYDLTKYRPK